MFSSKAIVGAIAAASLFSSEVCARVSKQDQQNYPSFAEAMKLRGGDMDWKSYKTTTRDGWNLVMFRITESFGGGGKRGGGAPPSKGPILLLHGVGSDAYSWTNVVDPSRLNLGAQLAQDGYDVWFANVRGTRFERSHAWLNPDAQDDQFFAFDNGTIGEWDKPHDRTHHSQ